MEIDKDKPVYVIGVVSEMLSIPPQMLRIYEKANLVHPKRTKQNTRLYSQTDIEKLKKIATLHQELGINLAGVEVILHLRQRMETMHEEFQRFIEVMGKRFGSELNLDLDENSTDLVPLSDQGAYIMKLIEVYEEKKYRENRDEKAGEKIILKNIEKAE